MKISNKHDFLFYLLFSTLFFSGCGIHYYNKAGWGRVASLPVPDEATRLGSPEWSPDGSSIVFFTENKFFDGGGTVSLVVSDLEESSYRIVDKFGGYVEAQWSPDSRIVALESGDGIKLIDVNTAATIRTLDTDYYYAAGWSQSETFITISWSDELNSLVLTDYGKNISEEEEANVYRVETRQMDAVFGGISFSSNHIIASIGTGKWLPQLIPDRNIIVMNFEGKVISSLGTEITDDFDPSVFPNNEEWFVYLAESDTVSIVFTNISRTCEYTFGTSEHFVTGLDISPDGQQLAVTIEDELLLVDFEDIFGATAPALIADCTGQ